MKKIVLIILLLLIIINCNPELSKIGDYSIRGDIESLSDLLDDEDWVIREAAVRNLSKTLDNRAVTPLIYALSDEHPNVKAAAIDSLTLFNDKRIVPSISKLLYDKSPLVRIYAIDALGDLIGKKASALIIGIYKNEKDYNVKEWSKYVLRRIGSSEFKKTKKIRKKKVKKTFIKKKIDKKPDKKISNTKKDKKTPKEIKKK
ncbi:MAG: HEAT repeat domain-containing protein [Spirochaetota bacterium]|nr:HEAT repeat domain-containing protein [Spirochaetota bacterium]